MNVAKCHHSVSFLMYCSVAVLVIVNGQSTTDDDIDKDESSRDTVEALKAELRAEFRAQLNAERAKSADAINSLKSQIAKLENKDKGKNMYNVSLLYICYIC